MSNSLKRVVVISPTYNEKGNIIRLCEVLLDDVFSKVSKEYDPHILIVDDSSPDGTGKEVLRLAQDYPNLHLLTNPKKLGLGNAYTKGMNFALEKLHADIVFEFDADFQHDPTRIPLMIKKLEAGNDIVLGSRYIPGGSIPAAWGFHRKLLSVGGNLFIRVVMLNFSVHDWTGGYRAIKRNVVETILPQLNSDTFMGYTFQIGLLYKAIKSGFRVAEVPINFVDRKYGESKLGTEYIKNILLYIFKERLKELTTSRVFRFALVGGIGTLVQLTSLQLLRLLVPFSFSNLVAIELAIVSNFILNNQWTFKDRAVTSKSVSARFLTFNLASAGSILIQMAVVIAGDTLIGLHPIGLIDTGLLFAVVGIVIGMIWNYIAYSKLVWRKV